MAEAVLMARGDISGPCDRSGLEKLEAMGVPGIAVDEARIRAAEVHMAVGSAKEGVAIAAGIQALQAELRAEQLMVHETGFTSCAKDGARYVSLSCNTDSRFVCGSIAAQLLLLPE